jgi:hypothetical protein
MTCRQAGAAPPALEGHKQLFPRVQRDEQPLSAGEPSVLGSPLGDSWPKRGLAAFQQFRWLSAVDSNGVTT